MKQLLIFRHAKSDWNAPYSIDHDRPLARRGVAAAKRMGRYLARLGQVPDRVISSSTVRAWRTVELAAQAGDWPCPLEATRELYDTTSDQVLEIIRGCADADSCLLLAGHQPTCSVLAGRLIGRAQMRFPTAAMAGIKLPRDRWGSVRWGEGSLVWFVTPKLLKSVM